jgi:hypothetical protein
MSLDENRRFEKSAITFEGKSFDLLDVPGAERLRVLEDVELASIFFGFEPSTDLLGMGNEGPSLVFFYRPRLNQPQFCEAGKSLSVAVWVRDSASVGPIYFNCDARDK